jgi:gamma-glutamylcyclotransferase (GGCT)/AIG2-like uncharacterized protein YtfP
MGEALIFVYGTLRPGAAAAHRMDGHGRWLGAATAAGSLHLLGAYPGMVVGEGIVHGALFAADDPEALLADLDIYEGCGPEDIAPHEYRRARVTVMQADQAHQAWTYLYNWPVGPDSLITSGDFDECSSFVLDRMRPKG